MKRIVLLLAACGGGGGDSDSPGVDAPPATTHEGGLFIQSYTAMQPAGTLVNGGMVAAAFPSLFGTCTSRTKVGMCEVRVCPTPTNPPASLSAGTITVTGAKLPVMLMPGADKKYAGFTTMQKLFDGGEMITFTTSGADVPAFTKAVPTPTKATITAPAEPATFLMINRAQGFTVSWTGGGSGNVLVYLDGGANRGTQLACEFPASGGSGTIPAATLAMLPAGQGAFAMSATTTTKHVAGDWSIVLETYFNAVWPDESIVSGPTMLQ